MPEILETIPEGKARVITDEDGLKLKIVTIRSYIEKHHKTNELTQFTVKQGTIEKPDKTRIKALYIAHYKQ